MFVLRHEGLRSCVPVYTGDSLFPINRIYEVANVKSVTRFPRSICKAGQFLAFLFSSPFLHLDFTCVTLFRNRLPSFCLASFVLAEASHFFLNVCLSSFTSYLLRGAVTLPCSCLSSEPGLPSETF